MSKTKSKNFKWLSSLMALVLFIGTFTSLKAQDVGVTTLVVPYDTICGSTNWPILVSLKNYNISQIDFSINNVTVNVTISGASTQTFTFVVNSGILNGYSSQNVTVTNLADMSAGGTHFFNANATVVGDINNTNDAMPAAPVFVKPTPTVNGEPNPSICAGTVMSAFNYISNPPGATFTWSNDNTSIGLAASGTGDRPSFIPVNNGGSPVIANITVQGSLNGCLGGTLGYLIQVNPLPTVNAGTSLTVCSGSSVTFTPSTTGAIAYSWSFGDGGTSTLLNPIYAYTIPGTYNPILTVVNSYGCAASDTMQITNIPASVGGTVSGGTDFCGISSSGILNLSGQTGSVLNWESSVDGGSTFTSITNNTTTQSYNSLTTTTLYRAIVQNSFCSQAVSTPDMITISTAAISNAGPSQTICSNAFANLTGSVGGSATSAFWTGGSGTFDNASSLNATYTPSTADIVSGSVNLTLVTNDPAGACSSASSSMTLTFSPNTNITGQVTYSGGNLSSGINKAILFKSLSILTAFDTVAVTNLDGSGNYYFTSIPSGDYLIKVFPDTSVYHTTIVPTYYGNKYLWDSAWVVTHGCGIPSVANIAMVENVSGVGPGSISGQIIQGDGFGRAPGDPVPGIDIKLGRNPGGQLFSNTQTDAGGNYYFANLPVDSYILFVDIPGLDRDSTYIVNVTSSNDQFNNLDYTVDSTTIHPNLSTVGISHLIKNENHFNIYPNPSKGNATIEYSISNNTEVSLSIFNVLGVKVTELINGHQSEGTYKVNIQESNKLRSGIYFVTLVKDGKAATQRLIITE